MKKNIIPLVVAGTLLVGCGSSSAINYTSEVSNGDKAVITIGDTKITNNEIYHHLLKQFGSSEVLSLALTYIADQEVTDKEAIKTKVDEKVASTKESLTTTSLDEVAKQYGFKNEQEYIDKIITVGVKQDLLKEKYIDKNYNDLIKEYKVKYLKIITVDTESGALSLIDKVKEGADFDTVMTENSGSDVGIVTTKSTNVDSKIIEKLDKFTKDGIYNKVIKTSESKYAVIYVYNSDKSKIKDDVKSGLASVSEMSAKMESYYLKQYNFDIYEEAIKDEIKESNEDYLG
ncbi:hypothetical protein CWE04_05225 [Thomasclavelia cocleata]|uniref:Foldase protein PrsA n=1 Tax=Thomasclavelia cocleata TaxID=69824 RepID=A0A1I0DYD6_9FIRM|nr:hypothetical protein [Thomasclavelia cocleata]MCR1961663.1 hypothetical protein [Thomasclavelia cocleata]NDO42044.1 hypothetical protein [Thomasclavelia cocleata]PJN80867.1 hypothetical protein CWE04_05225 [Thomasclavelia cocleata]SET37751.1 hypothetical protein SAMN04489758_10880 [Thomasclavelia cocleata]